MVPSLLVLESPGESGEVFNGFSCIICACSPCSFGPTSGGLVGARREILCKERYVNPM